MRAMISGVCAAFVLLASAGFAGPSLAQSGSDDATALIQKAARNQGHSLYVRDRCRYEQRLLMERYKLDKKTREAGELIAKRQTTVVVEPAAQPDETGQIPVTSRVVADTNDKGEPKDKVDPNARTGLASGAFLDQVFFPLVPENIEYLTFTEIPATAEGERWFKFEPRPDAAPNPDRPLASGVVQIDPATGEVLTMRITAFSNLKALDKHLDKILSFSAVVDYSQFAGSLRMPTVANGSGLSDVSRFEGQFKFIFEEGKYVAVLKVD